MLVIVTAGLIAFSQSNAFADDWLSSLFGSPSNNNSQNNSSGSYDQKQIQADQNAAQGFIGAINADNQNISNARLKLEQDRRAGVDITTDRQALQTAIQNLQMDQGRANANAQDLTREGVGNPYGSLLNTPTYGYNNGYNRNGYYTGYAQNYPGYASAGPDQRWQHGWDHRYENGYRYNNERRHWDPRVQRWAE